MKCPDCGQPLKSHTVISVDPTTKVATTIKTFVCSCGYEGSG